MRRDGDAQSVQLYGTGYGAPAACSMQPAVMEYGIQSDRAACVATDRVWQSCKQPLTADHAIQLKLCSCCWESEKFVVVAAHHPQACPSC